MAEPTYREPWRRDESLAYRVVDADGRVVADLYGDLERTRTRVIDAVNYCAGVPDLARVPPLAELLGDTTVDDYLDALQAVEQRCTDLLDRDPRLNPWTADYLRECLRGIAETVREAIAEDE